MINKEALEKRDGWREVNGKHDERGENAGEGPREADGKIQEGKKEEGDGQ